ncbi:MAG: DNA gyrase inhibitor YacG [Candidatus Acidiferrales bacterium]
MTRRCPICRRPTDSASNPDFPFCGERCRLLDLGRWAAERYRVSEPASAGTEFQEPPEFDEQHTADTKRR